MSLVKLSQSLIKKITKIKTRLNSQIEDMKSNFQGKCPEKKTLLEIVKKRNEITDALNKLRKIITTIDKVVNPLKTLLTALDIAINIAKINPAPAAGVTMGAVVIASDGLNFASIKVKGARGQLSAFNIIKQYILSIITNLINNIKGLDSLISFCLEEAAKAEREGLGGEGDGSLSDANLTPIEESTQNINQDEDSFLLSQLGLPNNNEYNSYKGFKFEIITDTNSKSRFLKRFAVAKNRSGVILLRGESSFSSSVKVLIEELKFIIDTQDLKAG